ncbi:MAG TPA: phenylalanine--tRNA ligase subunit beta [Candidatus Brocadiia bacterium]|nr:phenylalanine--tRNA ligase subunit beta [Candidatus Brocadiia bacterium]
MKVSYLWLKDCVDFNLSPEELADGLSRVGLVCESIERRGDDCRLEIEVTSNRPDCLCHLGVAREIAAMTGGRVKTPPTAFPENGPDATGLTSVAIKAQDLCPRYTARVIRNVRIEPSPEWLRTRLETVGLRAVNNVVDATNYVMFECGQPLHAFDFDKLTGKRIVVRRGREAEELVSIDRTTCKLTGEMLVIADAVRPVAIAGVMGGLDTEVGPETRNVLIESAFFDPANNRRTSRKLSLPSEATCRFERRVDPGTVEWASRRAVALILQMLPDAEAAKGVVDVNFMDATPLKVSMRPSRLNRLLGTEVPRSEAIRILKALDLELVSDDGESLQFLVPTFRPDLAREVDLIEEIARIHGYDRIPTETGAVVSFAARERSREVCDAIGSVMSGMGLSEVMTPSLVQKTPLQELNLWNAGESAALVNPISSEKTHMRRALIPNMLEAKRYNQNRGIAQVFFYELSKVYLTGLGGDPKRTARPAESDRPLEKMALGILTDEANPVGHIKGILDALLGRLLIGQPIVCSATSLPCFEEGTGIETSLGGRRFGVMGEASIAWLDQMDIRSKPAVGEFDADMLIELARFEFAYERPPAFPAMKRDLAIVLDESVQWAALENCVRRHGTDLIEDIAFIDLFRGKQVPEGKKSIALSVNYRSPDRTLTREEVDAIQASVIAAIEKELGGKLR